jgi:hypothetical protein
MADIVKARANLKRTTIVVEAIVIAVCAAASVQIATANGGNFWYCGPVLLIAALECLRYPLSSWMAHAKFFGMLLSAFVLVCVAVLTFEGVTLAVEQFMHQRVIVVMDAKEEVDRTERALANAQASAEANRADEKGLIEEINKWRAYKEKIAHEEPRKWELPKPQRCKGKNGATYDCTKGMSDVIKLNKQAEDAYETQVRDAENSLANAESKLKAFRDSTPSISIKREADAVAEAKKRLEREMLKSTMHRAAAAWFNVPVVDLSEGQFQTFKKWAMYGLASAVATATMFVSFVASLPSRSEVPSLFKLALRAYLVSRRKVISTGKESKLRRALRAYLARKRKNVVRVVTKTVELEKTVEKIVEVEKLVDRIIEIPKYVFVPVKDGHLINADGSHGEPVSSLRAITGGKP